MNGISAQNCNPRLAGAARRQGYTNSPSQHLSVPLRQHSGGGSSGCLHNLIILHQKQDEFPADNISRCLKRLPANEPATSAASSRGQSADESQQQAALQPHSQQQAALQPHSQQQAAPQPAWGSSAPPLAPVLCSSSQGSKQAVSRAQVLRSQAVGSAEFSGN